MKIFVTGGSGFLGTHLCEKLKSLGNEVTSPSSKDCNLINQNSLNNFSERYDYIYHLAAWTQAGDFCIHHPGEQWIINQKINTNVLDWWHKYQSQAKLVAIGTSCAYSPEYELVEENYLKGMPIDSLFTYAMTKRMLYSGLLALNKQYGMRYLCVVPSTLYGPGYHTDVRQMHFIFDLIRKILRGKYLDEKVILWGDGEQKRELVYVDDFVSILLQAAANHNNELVNVGGGEEYSIKNFAKIISEKLNYDHNKIEYDTTKYVGARSKCLNINKIEKMLPGIKKIDLNIGIKKTVEWFLENQSIFLK
jgi:GDP-L-fucose synthase